MKIQKLMKGPRYLPVNSISRVTYLFHYALPPGFESAIFSCNLSFLSIRLINLIVILSVMLIFFLFSFTCASRARIRYL